MQKGYCSAVWFIERNNDEVRWLARGPQAVKPLWICVDKFKV